MLNQKLMGAAASGGYEIQRSLRFNSADSAYLNRTPGSAGNRKTWTYSGWVKRSALGANRAIFAGNAAANDSDYLAINFLTDDALSVEGWTSVWRKTTQVFRDVSAWYHIVVAWDTTQATAANRVKIYVNNVEVTSFSVSANPSLDATSGVNATSPHYISTYDAANQFFNGYMTEINFIDGQALTPSSFGAFDAQTGVWGPTRYAGSYGTNGFYLNFSDSSNTTAATLGRDYSGNGNNWTPNNFSVSAGAGNDSLVDVPTNWGTDTGVGGSVRGNYCTVNPLDKSGYISLANGNLQVSNGTDIWAMVRSTFGMTSGKWYWECSPTSSSGAPNFIYGISRSGANLESGLGFDANGWGYYVDGQKYTNNAGAVYGSSWTLGDVIGVAFDADAGTLTFYKNGTSQGTAFSSLTSGPYFPTASSYGTSSAFLNFGQRPFAYTAPSGFKALNTQNLPTPTIGATTATQAGNYFAPTIYTGNGANNRTITTGLQSDFVWIKNRSSVAPHLLFDVIRGAGQTLYSNLTNAEVNNGTSYVQQFNSNNFLLGVVDGAVNGNGENYVSWVWKANGAGVTNTAGSITSTVSANTTSGFSVVTFTGINAGATVGHGLGSVPRMIIMKARNAADNWYVYHVSIGAPNYLILNGTAAAAAAGSVWNNTTPTSSVFSIGNNTGTGTQVAYCFAEVPGYSSFGSYTGNGSADGPFVFCGFRPAYILFKRSSGTGDWGVFDVKRNTFNSATNVLFPNLSNAEVAFSAGLGVDILSNGFKIRSGPSDIFNASGSTHIFAAFAEMPQKFALAR